MNDEIRRIERRIAAWSQIPATHGEPIQVLRYQIGQEYQSHFDYFFHEGGKNNNRIATVLMYLSDVKVFSPWRHPYNLHPHERVTLSGWR